MIAGQGRQLDQANLANTQLGFAIPKAKPSHLPVNDTVTSTPGDFSSLSWEAPWVDAVVVEVMMLLVTIEVVVGVDRNPMWLVSVSQNCQAAGGWRVRLWAQVTDAAHTITWQVWGTGKALGQTCT